MFDFIKSLFGRAGQRPPRPPIVRTPIEEPSCQDRYRNPNIGDWTYNTERKGDGYAISLGSMGMQAWPSKEEAVAAFLRCHERHQYADNTTLVLLQYQECIDRSSIRWAGEPDFVDEKMVASRRWRRVEEIRMENDLISRKLTEMTITELSDAICQETIAALRRGIAKKEAK